MKFKVGDHVVVRKDGREGFIFEAEGGWARVRLRHNDDYYPCYVEDLELIQKSQHRKLISQMKEAAEEVWFDPYSSDAETRSVVISVLNDFIEAFEQILKKETEDD